MSSLANPVAEAVAAVLLPDADLATSRGDRLRSILTKANENHHILFGRGLINHASQTTVALAILGASEERLADFLAGYSVNTGYGHLDPVPEAPPDLPAAATEPDSDSSASEAVASLLHRYRADLHFKERSAIFRPLVAEWEALFGRFGSAAVAMAAVPLLGTVLFAGAFHPLIHMGLAIKTNCPRTLSESLSLACISPLYVSHLGAALQPALLDCEEVLPSLTLSEVIARVRDHEWPPIEGVGFPGKHAFLLGDAERLALFLQLVRAWKPSDVLADDLRSLELTSAAAYAGRFGQGCDFFLLHGITSLWALKSLLGLFEQDPSTQRALLRHYLLFLLTAYVIQKTPAPTTSVTDTPLPLADLPALVARARASNDEHIPKLAVALLESAALSSSEQHSQFFIDVLHHSLNNIPTPQSYVFNV